MHIVAPSPLGAAARSAPSQLHRCCLHDAQLRRSRPRHGARQLSDHLSSTPVLWCDCWLVEASLSRTTAPFGHDPQSCRHKISSAGSSVGRRGIRPSLIHSCHPRRDNLDALWPAYVQIYSYCFVYCLLLYRCYYSELKGFIVIYYVKNETHKCLIYGNSFFNGKPLTSITTSHK